MHRQDADYIIALANRIFGDPDQARKWLDRPNLQLGGRPPRALLGSADGVRRVEERLTQIDGDDRLGID